MSKRPGIYRASAGVWSNFPTPRGLWVVFSLCLLPLCPLPSLFLSPADCLFRSLGPPGAWPTSTALFAGWERQWEGQPMIPELGASGQDFYRHPGTSRPSVPGLGPGLQALAAQGAFTPGWSVCNTSPHGFPPGPQYTVLWPLAGSVWALHTCFCFFFFKGSSNFTHYNISHGTSGCGQAKETCHGRTWGGGRSPITLPRIQLPEFSIKYVVPALYSWQSAFTLSPHFLQPQLREGGPQTPVCAQTPICAWGSLHKASRRGR